MYKTSSLGISLIKKYEGLKLEQYFCPAKISTIGIGTTKINGKPVPIGLKITVEQANEYLKNDLVYFENQVNSLVKSKINQNMFDALICFSYNLGIGNLKASDLLEKVNLNPNDKTIKDEFLRWKKAGGVVLKGLVLRRTDEASLYFS
jgi:lysozyme